MKFFHSLGHVFGGTLLIAGTTIGVGMLALPVATAKGGFIPALILYLLCWVFNLATGLLTLEACHWLPGKASFISMSERFLGKLGKYVTWALYLFLFVTVLIAHILGGGQVFSEAFSSLSPPIAAILYLVIFVPFIYLGARSVDRLNIFLMAGVLITYVGFISLSNSFVKLENLQRANWKDIWFALPILYTAFGYQVIIPTLYHYMDNKVKKVRKSIIFGTLIPLVVYLIWELLILGIIPLEGTHGLLDAQAQGYNAVIPLKNYINQPWLMKIASGFAFFTLTASFITIALAYMDFLADGIHFVKGHHKKIIIALIVFVPPLIISLTYPKIFLVALEYCGGISCALLFGLLPILMVWSGRYIKKLSKDAVQLKGGKPLLLVLILFVVSELVMQFVHF